MKRLLLFTLLFIFSNYVNAQGWGQTQKIVPDDRATGQQFGSDLDIDGNYAVVGVFANGGSEEAYVFENDGSGNWLQVQKLENPNYSQYDQFGSTVAISGDYIFVGAWGEHYDSNNSNYLQSAGAVYIFKKQTSGLFEFEQKIVASDREAFNAFGYGIAVNSNYAVVSPVRHDFDVAGENFLDDAGAAYIFERDGTGTWNEVQKIVASDRAIQDFFGQSALTVSGNYIAVGSYGDDQDENDDNTISTTGSAYIFERDTNGTWNEVQKIVASDRSAGAFFGWSIALDGNNLAVGANRDTNFTGAAYMFEKDGNDVWNEVGKLTTVFGLAGDSLGQSVDIDGDRVVIGAWFTDIGGVGDGGAAYVFEKDGTGFWNETAVMYDPDANNSDYFGFSVAISGDYSLVGAYQEDEDDSGMNFVQEAGSAYIFNVNEPNTLPPLNTLSIVESDFNANFKAYPNPTNGQLTIDLKETYPNVNISIHNVLGQTILSRKYTNTKVIQLELMSQPKGLYIVQLKFENKMVSKLKIVKH